MICVKMRYVLTTQIYFSCLSACQCVCLSSVSLMVSLSVRPSVCHLFVCLSVFLSFCSCPCPSGTVFLTVNLSVRPFPSMSFCLSVHPYVYPSVLLSVCVFVCLSVWLCLSDCQPVRPSLPFDVFLSVGPSLCLSFCSAVCLIFRLSICLALSF